MATAIKTIEVKLLDGSLVYDVIVNSAGGMLRIACVSERDADSFSEGLRRLIENHTNDTVRVLTYMVI